MRSLTFAMNASVDGDVAGPGDDLGWSAPSDELFQWWSDWNARLVTSDAVAEITRLKADDGGSMDIAGATLAAAAMRAGPLGEPGPGGDPFFRRRHPSDEVRDAAL